VQQFLDKDP